MAHRLRSDFFELLLTLGQAREMIEVSSAEAAANGASESQIQDILTKMEAVPVDASPDPAGFVDADVAFHRAILRATNTHSHSRRCRPYTVSCVSGWK